MQNMSAANNINASSFPDPDGQSNVTIEAPSAPLLGYADDGRPHTAPEDLRRRRPSTAILLMMTLVLGVGLFLVVRLSREGYGESSTTQRPDRGVKEGVSAKNLGRTLGPAYPWTAKLLDWQRTAYHFQPKKNWMNGECDTYISLFIYLFILIFKLHQ